MTSLATTEPESGSDAASITTTATRVDGGYRITGQKAWISNAGAADLRGVRQDRPHQALRGGHGLSAREGTPRA